MAVGDAGAIPYYSDWDTIDYLGLNDVRIAHSLRDPSFSMPAYVYGLKPDILVLASPDRDRPAPYPQGGIRDSSYQLSKRPEFQRYRLLASWRNSRNPEGYYILIYGEESWKHVAELTKGLLSGRGFETR